MLKFYDFGWDCGRLGRVEGLFIAEESDVAAAIGKVVNFGEILGKHSEIYGVLEEHDLEVKSEDQDFIAKLEEMFDSKTISGYNPLDPDYLEVDNDE